MLKYKTKLIITIALIVINTNITNAQTVPKMNYIALYIGSSKAYVNDVLIPLDKDNSKVVAFIDNSRTMVPIRLLSENYGGSVEWDNATQNITVTFPDKVINMVVGANEITVNGTKKSIDTPAVITESRTYLPLRACVEALGKHVFYDRGLILISDVENILDKDFDSDIVDLLISFFN